MALPGFGIVMEIMPVFTRKPLFAYKVAAAGMLGVALLSFFVWQHHLFQSGINPDMRPLFMLTTELISIPTGFLFLVTLGTLWKAKIRFDTPMLFCLGHAVQLPHRRRHRRLPLRRPGQRDGARQLLRAGALPLHDHGRPDLRPLRRLLLLVPEDHRARRMNRKLSKWHFWTFFIFFNLHVLPAVPRRAPRPAPPGVRVRHEPADAERHLERQRLLPRCVVLLLHRQLRLVDLPEPARGAAQPVELARPGVADADAGAVVQLRAHPGRARTTPTTTASPTPPPVADLGTAHGGRRRARGIGQPRRPRRPACEGDGDPRPPIL